MRDYGITIDDIDYREQCTALTITDYANAVGRFDAALRGTHDITGFQTVKIYDDGVQVFQGRVGSPVKENVPGGSYMPLGGLEWTGNLKDYITDYEDKTQQTLTQFLTDALVNSIYGIGDIDELEQTEIEMQVWEAALDFLPFTFTGSCIVYGTDVEVTDQPSTIGFEFPDSNRRTCFYDKANGFFYVIGYDEDNNLLKYNSTSDLSTWTGWSAFPATAPAAADGDNGTYGIAWDEANATLFMIVNDGTNLDSYELTTTAAGALTYVDHDLSVATNADLVAGPALDDEGDVWFICEDTTTTRYELWQFDISANTWTKETDWLVSSNDDPRYIFRGSATGDVIVIMFNDDTDVIEEWLWDESGSTFAKVRDITPLANGDCGYLCGYQDTSDNMFIVWEDEIVGDGDADLNFSRKTIGATVWETLVTIVEDANYQTMNQFQLSGDDADNLYLFYLNDDGATRTLDIIRRLEETWGSTVEVDTDVDVSSAPRSPANGQALFTTWLSATDDEINASLMEPYAITATATYSAAEEEHGYESGKDFDSEATSSGSTIVASTDWAAEGVQSVKSYTPAYAVGQKNAYGVYTSPDHSEIWVRGKIKVTQADDWGTLSSANDEAYFLSGYGTSGLFWAGWGINGAGVITWQVECRNGALYVLTEAGTPVIGTEYCIEVHWTKGATGSVQLYVDDALMCDSGAQDTADYGNCASLFAGLICNNRDGPTTSYIDAVAWGANGDNRVGCIGTGWFRTDSYTATASMNEWGSLNSTDDDDANVSWSVYVGAAVDATVDDLITAVDLEDAGVADTDDPIQIRADITGERTYVQDVRLGEKQGFLDYILDNEPASTGIKKQADIIGYEYKLGWDNLVTMVEQLGEDKSDYIILLTARSQSAYPDTKPNIMSINREPDFDSFANAVKILGAGDYPSRKEGSAKDQDSIDEFGVHWVSVTNKDCTTIGMCNTFARTEVNIRKDPLERIDVAFYDDYDAKDIEVGDIVTVVDEETDLNQTARIVSLTYGWNASGRFSNASLINRNKAKTFIEYLAEVTDLKRWI